MTSDGWLGGGWSLRPSTRALARAETFEEVRDLYREAATILDRFQAARQAVVEAWRAQREAALAVERARAGKRRGIEFYDWETAEQKEARAAEARFVAEYNARAAEAAELEAEAEALADRIRRNFVVLDAGDIRDVGVALPEKSEVMDAVGVALEWL